jgi:hypothetical protein
MEGHWKQVHIEAEKMGAFVQLTRIVSYILWGQEIAWDLALKKTSVSFIRIWLKLALYSTHQQMPTAFFKLNFGNESKHFLVKYCLTYSAFCICAFHIHQFNKRLLQNSLKKLCLHFLLLFTKLISITCFHIAFPW